MVDAKVAQAFAEGRVPTNITYLTPEYLSETRDPPAIAGIIVVFVITSILLVCRFLSRIFIVKSFGLDDSIAAVSYALYTAFMALGLVLIYEGSGHHIEYIQYVLTIPEVNNTEVLDYAAHLIYTATLFFCRMSGLAFFNRLCSKHPTFRVAIWLAAGFLTSAFLVQFFLILLHCSPTTGLWPYEWQPQSADYTCLNWGVVYVTNSGLSLVCDFVLFSIPFSMITILRLTPSRRAVLAVVLLPGTLVIGISIARLYLCVVGQWRTDGSWFYDPQIAIEVGEIGATLIALSVPSFKPILSQWYGKMKSSIDSRGHSTAYGQGASKRKTTMPPEWTPPLDSKLKTEIHSRGGNSSKSRGSGSDDELIYQGDNDIYVVRDVDLTSIPLAHVRRSISADIYS